MYNNVIFQCHTQYCQWTKPHFNELMTNVSAAAFSATEYTTWIKTCFGRYNVYFFRIP